MKMSLFEFEEARLKASKLAEAKLARGENADEFVQLAEVDGFKLYVCAGKTIKTLGKEHFHSNPRDCFHLLLQGEMELTFENSEKINVAKGQYFVLPKGVEHRASFKGLTIALVGVYEKDL